jgi:hypothetical protein
MSWRGVSARRACVRDDGTMLESLKQRVIEADLPDPVFAALGAVDLALKAPWAAGRYYTDLVDRGHDRLVEVGTQRAVRKRVSNRMENRASQIAVRYKQRQRRQRRSA